MEEVRGVDAPMLMVGNDRGILDQRFMNFDHRNLCNRAVREFGGSYGTP
jgi:hypothetical protein